MLIIEMTPRVKKLYKESIRSDEFNSDMKKQDPIGYCKPPELFSSEKDKLLYACAYYGWLLGKGEYCREKYN